jgi:uncharacterized cupredoxin-like copper-binding protein
MMMTGTRKDGRAVGVLRRAVARVGSVASVPSVSCVASVVSVAAAVSAIVVLSAALSPATALAHGSTSHGSHGAAQVSGQKEQKPWGIAGDPRRVARTITVSMTDDMQFRPGTIEVRRGETIRLRVRNDGKVLHELVIGTRQELDEHAAMMVKFPNMEHDDPWMVHVDPGKSGDLVWHFNRAGEFEFACLIPGHYQAGMTGRIRVVEPAQSKGRHDGHR